MNFNKLILIGLSLSILAAAPAAHADDENLSAIKIEEPSGYGKSTLDQIVTLQLMPYQPSSLKVTNGNYSFDYGDASTVMVEASWATKLFSPFGSFYLQEGIGYSQFGGNSVQTPGTVSASSYNLNVFGFDSRIMYTADFFPWKALLPFADAGYLYSFYYQPGTSGLDSTGGGVGNFVSGAGLKLCLNPKALRTASGNPWFLSAKYNWIFDNASSVNFASTSFAGGLSIGL